MLPQSTTMLAEPAIMLAGPAIMLAEPAIMLAEPAIMLAEPHGDVFLCCARGGVTNRHGAVWGRLCCTEFLADTRLATFPVFSSLCIGDSCPTLVCVYRRLAGRDDSRSYGAAPDATSAVWWTAFGRGPRDVVSPQR